MGLKFEEEVSQKTQFYKTLLLDIEEYALTKLNRNCLNLEIRILRDERQRRESITFSI